MRRSREVFYVGGDEEEGLISKLKENGFDVGRGWPYREVYHRTDSGVTVVGGLEVHFKGYELSVFEKTENPLKDFVSSYMEEGNLTYSLTEVPEKKRIGL